MAPVGYPGLNTQDITRETGLRRGRRDTAAHAPGCSPFVLKCSVYTGFASDDNQPFAATLLPGDVIVFPKGLSHFQLNVANETFITFNSLISQSPEFLTTVTQIFGPNITSAAIEKSFGVDAATVRKLKDSYPRI